MRKTGLSITKGDIFLLDNLSANGHVQKSFRPHVVVTQIVGETVSIAPFTTNSKKKNLDFIVEVKPDTENKLDSISFVLINQVFTCDISILNNKMGHLKEDDVLKVQLELIKYFSK